MKIEILIYQELFDSDIEQATAIISEYLDILILAPNYSKISLGVFRHSKGGKSEWVGKFLEVTEWGKENIIYGRIEIVEDVINCPKPIQISIYCPSPNFININIGLRDFIISRLQASDGLPEGSVPFWNLIPDKGKNRAILELWHRHKTASDIGERFSLSTQVIYNKLHDLRKAYGTEIVPSRKKDSKTH